MSPRSIFTACGFNNLHMVHSARSLSKYFDAPLVNTWSRPTFAKIRAELVR